MFSSALCCYYYVPLRSHLLCKCNRHNLTTVLTLCRDVCVPVLWDCVFMLGVQITPAWFYDAEELICFHVYRYLFVLFCSGVWTRLSRFIWFGCKFIFLCGKINVIDSEVESISGYENIKLFIKHKILSRERILNMHACTHTHLHSQTHYTQFTNPSFS